MEECSLEYNFNNKSPELEERSDIKELNSSNDFSDI